MGKRRSREFKKNSDIIDIKEARKKRAEKKKALENERKAAKKAAKKRHKKESKPRKGIKLSPLFVIVIIIIGLVIVFTTINLASLKAEQNSVMKEHQELQKEKKKLEKELSKLNDPDYIEQQAREQLKLIMPGEKLFVLPEKSTSKDKD